MGFIGRIDAALDPAVAGQALLSHPVPRSEPGRLVSSAAMASRTDERSRVLGGLLCFGAIAAAALFLAGVLARSYWALAIPVTVVVLFVLGLVSWIGWTIATVQVEAEGERLSASGSGSGGAGGATRGDASADENTPSES